MSNVLVIQLARLGDILQSKRLIHSVLADGDAVHLAVDQSLAAFAAQIYPFARVHGLAAHAGDRDEAAALRHNAAVFAQLGGLGFSAVYNLNRSPLSLALAGLFAPESVRGYRLERGQALSSTWAKMAARWTGDRPSSPMNLVDFWAFFHPRPIAPGLVNPVPRPKNAPGGSGQLVGVTLAGRSSRRSLPPAELAACVEAVFAARKGPRLLLLGSESEAEAARKLCRDLRPATRSRVEDLCGRTTLDDLPELVGSLDLLITPDTGLMHLAAHLGTPVLAVFLSSAWAWETGPYGLGHTVFQAVTPCAPCLESAPCPRKLECLAPFRPPLSAAWLEHLAGGRPEIWPNGLLGLVSGLDELGAVYRVVDGMEDEKAARLRQEKREFLREYLLGDGGSAGGNPEGLVAEKDWILPDYF